MALLEFLGISSAYAAGAAAPAHPTSFLSTLPMLVLIAGVFYFLLIRPQRKRAKAQKDLLSQLKIGDEIITIGGFVARINEIQEQFVVVSFADKVSVMLRKAAIESVLPKGTMESGKS